MMKGDDDDDDMMKRHSLDVIVITVTLFYMLSQHLVRSLGIMISW